MTQLSASLLLLIALFALFQKGQAGPACARRHYKSDSCVSKCSSKWGWPGKAMGTDPWGAVMKPSTESASSKLPKVCGTSVTAAKTATAASSGATGPVKAVAPAPAAPSTTEIAAPSTTHSTTHTTSSSSSSKTTSHVTTSTAAPPPKANTFKAAAPPSSSPPPAPKPTQQAAPQPAKAAAPAPKQAAPKQEPPQQSSGGGSSGSSTSGSDEQQYLSLHNSFRAQHGAGSMTWDDNLASKAQQWANNCQFHHSGGSLGPFGENLAAGTGDSYGIADGIKSWTDESSEYNPSSPQASHFTQVVWKGSNKLGCAMSLCDGIFASSFGKAKFIVCEYSAQGNVQGEFGQNVQ